MTVPVDEAELRHISPDGSSLLAYGSLSAQTGKHLWLVPTAGGGPRRLGSIDGEDAAWSSDGRHILYAHGYDLFIAEEDGSNSRKLVTTPGKAFWLRCRRMVRAYVSRWSIKHPTHRPCGNVGPMVATYIACRSPGTVSRKSAAAWGSDGKYFFFRTFLDARADLWSIAEPGFFGGNPKPIRLTSGPLEFASAILSRSGKQLLTVGLEPKWEVLSYNLRTQRASTWIPDRSAYSPSTSRDGRWIAYVEIHGKESVLWRSKPDGNDRLQLSEPPLFVTLTRLSPDGKQIAFMGKTPINHGISTWSRWMAAYPRLC